MKPLITNFELLKKEKRLSNGGCSFFAVDKTKEQKHYAITFIVIQEVFPLLSTIAKTFHSAACEKSIFHSCALRKTGEMRE